MTIDFDIIQEGKRIPIDLLESKEIQEPTVQTEDYEEMARAYEILRLKFIELRRENRLIWAIIGVLIVFVCILLQA